MENIEAMANELIKPDIEAIKSDEKEKIASARHEACHVMVAISLGYPASACISERKLDYSNDSYLFERFGVDDTVDIGKAGGETIFYHKPSDHSAPTAEEEILIRIAPLAYRYISGVAEKPLDNEELLQYGGDFITIQEFLKKFKQKIRDKIYDRCMKSAYEILKAHPKGIEHITEDLVSGKTHVYWMTNENTMNRWKDLRRLYRYGYI